MSHIKDQRKASGFTFTNIHYHLSTYPQLHFLDSNIKSKALHDGATRENSDHHHGGFLFVTSYVHMNIYSYVLFLQHHFVVTVFAALQVE